MYRCLRKPVSDSLLTCSKNRSRTGNYESHKNITYQQTQWNSVIQALHANVISTASYKKCKLDFCRVATVIGKPDRLRWAGLLKTSFVQQ